MWHQQKQQQYIAAPAKSPFLLPPPSSPSPSFHPSIPQTPRRTMEEVWRDIALNAASPIQENIAPQAYFHHQVPANLNLSHFRDFLARPLRPISGSVQLAAAPPPATVLSLNSATDSQFLKSMKSHSSSSTSSSSAAASSSSSSCSSSSSISASALSDSPTPGLFMLCDSKKRAPSQQLPDPGSDDGRSKRMIKNRESAARSRARKQAYTNELELEVNHLTEENEKLRRQHEELRAKMAAQMSTKRALQRSSTAPF